MSIDTDTTQQYSQMDHADRAAAIGKAVWGYENEQLSMQDLKNILVGKHGQQIAQDFIETLATGVIHPGTRKAISFVSLCSYYRTFDSLESIVALAPEIAHLPGQAGVTGALSTSQWIDMLCTRRDIYGELKTYSLFKHAASRTGDLAEQLLSLALQHQPGHPDIEEVLAQGGTGGAILAQVLMRRQIGAQLDVAPASEALASVPRRNRQL